MYGLRRTSYFLMLVILFFMLLFHGVSGAVAVGLHNHIGESGGGLVAFDSFISFLGAKVENGLNGFCSIFMTNGCPTTAGMLRVFMGMS